MCGLVAWIGDPRGLDAARLEAALDTLTHRGPDGRGSWHDRAAGVWLGHRRLAIVDRAGGAQPIASPSGDIVAVVSGEFYDDARLRRELAHRGHRFRSLCDAELLVHLYEAHGERALADLRGEFAFVLWDGRRRAWWAARDRFGVRPLVAARVPQGLVFASEAKALFAAGVPAAWDHEAWSEALALQYPAPGRTLFRGVEAIEPGFAWSGTVGDGVRRTRYWDTHWPPTDESPWSEAESIERTAAAFDEAIALRLRADVPVAAHLSGGVDSTAVAVRASQLGGRPIPCFTVAFDHPDYDESALARSSAAAAGLELRVVRLDQLALRERFAPAVVQGEGLAINLHIAAKHALNEAIARDGFRVALTGEGADEVFAGYAHLRADAWGPEAWASLYAENRVSSGTMLPSGPTLDLHPVVRRLGFVPQWIAAKAAMGRRLATLLDRDASSASARATRMERWLDAIVPPGRLDRLEPARISLYTWTKTALAGYILRTLGDGMEMAHAVEGRLPFLDHHLFEVVRHTPWRVSPGQREKRILREVVRPYVPAAIVDRPKHPFLAPPSCSATAVPPWRIDEIAALPGVDGAAVAALVARWDRLDDDERRAWDPALTLLWSAALLQEHYHL